MLPGCAQPDADYFSHASGETFVALPTFEGQQPSFATRPLLSPADIRNPACEHNLLGRPATLFFGPITFQAYLQRAFELPEYADVLCGHSTYHRPRKTPQKTSCHPRARKQQLHRGNRKIRPRRACPPALQIPRAGAI
ncbi:MAG UNVERIFIED_CONTAM: hypothetical protein LVR18_30625 [Planctomycetaceae bacterium]